MDVDDALALIEKQFGKRKSKEEFLQGLVERGKLCATCLKIQCDCDCDCKSCWGKICI